MSRTRLLVCLLVTLFVPLVNLSAQDHGAFDNQKVELPKYMDLLGRLQAGDTTIDFTALRISWTRTHSYDPYDNKLSELREQMFKNLDAHHYPEALKSAQKILDRRYIDFDAHVVCSIILDSLADSALASLHLSIAGALLRSVEMSGSGSSVDSAFLVVCIEEEYALVQAHEYEIKTQALSNEKERTFDVLTGPLFRHYYPLVKAPQQVPLKSQ
jgi:hypothetical protein